MSGFKLYEISEELMTLEDMLYDDTVDQETVQDTLEMINMDFEDKADNYAKIIRTNGCQHQGAEGRRAETFRQKKSPRRETEVAEGYSGSQYALYRKDEVQNTAVFLQHSEEWRAGTAGNHWRA